MKVVSVIAAALVGAASAAEELFLSNRQQDLSDVQSIDDVQALIKQNAGSYKLQNGLCQPMFGYQVFDLASVDSAMGLKDNQDTTELNPSATQLLQFNLCN